MDTSEPSRQWMGSLLAFRLLIKDDHVTFIYTYSLPYSIGNGRASISRGNKRAQPEESSVPNAKV